MTSSSRAAASAAPPGDLRRLLTASGSAVAGLLLSLDREAQPSGIRLLDPPQRATCLDDNRNVARDGVSTRCCAPLPADGSGCVKYERTRRARDIHDVMGPATTAIKSDVAALLRGLPPRDWRRESWSRELTERVFFDSE